jgi:hypothetical protein
MRSMAINGRRVEWQKYLRIRPGEKKRQVKETSKWV